MIDGQTETKVVPILTRAELRELSFSERSERRRGLCECLRTGEQSPEEEAELRQLDGIVFKGTREWRIAMADLHHVSEVACLQKRAVSRVSRERLEKMSTRRLLARLNKLRKCMEALDCSEFSEEHAAEVKGILFKDSEEWKMAYTELKEILATREHLPRGGKSRCR